MTGHPVLIFGGVGGIGEALARQLRSRGIPVVVSARQLERAEQLANEIGGIAVAADVLDEASIAAATTAASGATGGLSGVVYAVGSIPLGPLARVTSEQMVDAYRLNVVGAMLAVKHAEAALRSANGAVVLFSSIAATQGFANHAVIASAKAAIEGLTLALAAELAPHVRVNAVAPSLTRTGIADSFTRNAKMAEAIAALHPLPRLGEPDDMASAAAYLQSDAAGWITGQILRVDGGRSSLRVGRS